MHQEELLKALDSQAKAVGGFICEVPDFPQEIATEVTYSEWQWSGCRVRHYQEEDDFWVLLPGFSSWVQLIVIDE